MSLTSYRAAPPRDPNDGLYIAPVTPPRKRFREELYYRDKRKTVRRLQVAGGSQAGFSCPTALSMNCIATAARSRPMIRAVMLMAMGLSQRTLGAEMRRIR